ncbi:MGDG synthase family glycosyltransferase [Deinococcus hopiensis]|uniref:Processive 1,2-diacylglycerol beta-glucosyltransferase n=1 Tax=Deinococcus hopiensis KR-140 TaxID=695939 RepID=A0A1W1VDX3_9DEIO|nr:glycosyltransferase [Deinococcus hopiensis]SMB91413.1 processive 1,2-diacylglycerol beta-glucosyltransferase [Deinococcus hopiensis KR-140]
MKGRGDGANRGRWPEAFSRATSPGPDLNVFILSASFGSGHKQANEALEGALRHAGAPVRVRHRDYVTYGNAWEKAVTVGLYHAWLKYAPGVYRRFYHLMDREDEPWILANAFNWLGQRGMLPELRELRPDVVVCGHPTPVGVADGVRRRLRADFPIALIVTDYYVHHHSARHEAQLLMVANPEGREEAARWGIRDENVAVTGIPISPVYRGLLGADRRALREKHGLRPDLPLVLLSGGGTGIYHAQARVLAELSNLGRHVQVLVLAGATERGVRRIGGATVHSLGYTLHFPELLAASDLVVGKAGGLTVAEATALGAPMVLHEPIPGQEEKNAAYLVRHGAALWAQDIGGLRSAVLRALDGDEHARLSAASRALGVPDAADRAAAALLHKLGRVPHLVDTP